MKPIVEKIKQNYLLMGLFFILPLLNTAQEMDKVLALPTSSELGNFGRTPVGLFTGTNQVSIPLYELKTKNLAFPINLNYSSNGFIVDKVASRYGYDWTLSAEGVVVRGIRGCPDDTKQFTSFPADLDTSHTFTLNECNSITNYFNSWEFYGYDSEPDMYSFNFCGYTGQCYRDFETDKMVTVPFQDLNIGLIRADTFRITDSKGIQYFFEEGEESFYDMNGFSVTTTSSFYLTKIVHPLGDSILFNYSSTEIYSFKYGTSISDAVSRAMYNGGEGSCSQSYTPAWGPIVNLSDLTGYYNCLESITAPGYGKVVFDWAQGRSDFIEPRLAGLAVVSQSGDTIRHVSLHHIFEHTSNEFNTNTVELNYDCDDSEELFYRMFLDSVSIKDQTNNDIQKYAFEYNAVGNSYGSTLPSRLSYAQDHWGYFNGVDNSSLLPDSIPVAIKQSLFQTLDSTRVNANRSANYLYARKGMLSKVIFPTGGYTEYEYEAHRSDGHPNEEHGGVRLKNQKSYTEYGQLAHTTTYSYSGGNAGWDRDDIQYYYEDNVSKYCCYDSSKEGSSSFDIYVLKSNPLYSLYLSGGTYIGYEKVTIYNGDSLTNSGKEEHEFEIGFDDYYSELLYEEHSWDDHFFPRPYINYGWKNGAKLSEKYYKNVSNIYTPVKEVLYQYKEDTANCIFNFYPVVQCDDFEDIDCAAPLLYSTINYHFRVALYWNISKWQYRSSRVEKLYNDNGIVMINDTTRYYYDNPTHAQLTRIERTPSNGGVKVEKIRYPSDIGAGNYASMAALNMHNYPIEQTTLLDNDVINSKLTTYKEGGGSYVPDELYYTETTSAQSSFSYFNDITKDSSYPSLYEKKFEYDSNGNIIEIVSRDGIYTCYLWGYDNNYPIAKIDNATIASVKSKLGGNIPDFGSGGLSSSQESQLRTITGAQVTVYTYKPGIGMLSQTDPTGVTTYYMYDNFGRLSEVKNDDENLLKKYQYNYIN